MDKKGCEYLAAGMSIHSVYQAKEMKIKPKFSLAEKIIWINEKARNMGYKLFTIRDMEAMTRLNKKKIQEIMQKMINNGHIK